MTDLEVKYKPGPKAVAALLWMAGFSPAATYPAITDGCGVVWHSPSELQIMGGIVGGESSDNWWCYNVNANKTVDYGGTMINSSHSSYFDQYSAVNPTAWNWMNPLDNARAAYALYKASGWKPWNAYSGGGYKKLRWTSPVNGPHSWLTWSQHGIIQCQAAVSSYALQGKMLAQALPLIASVNLDPLELS